MKSHYEHFVTPSNKVIAVSTYAGKTVRGVAKCSPEDEFDVNIGIDLAEARCNLKIAEKRKARAKQKKEEAYKAYTLAWKRLIDMDTYLRDADSALVEAREDVHNVLSSLKKNN